MNSSDIEWFADFSADTQASITRLLKHTQKSSLGARLAVDAVLYTLASEFDYANQRSDWDRTTQRERTEWQHKLDQMITDLVSHSQSGPLPIRSSGFPVPPDLMIELLESLNYPFLRHVDSVEQELEKHQTVSRASNLTDFSLLDALAWYQDRARNLSMAPQVLKHPARQKAARREFIIRVKDSGVLSTADIATVTSVMFQDDTVDEREVRRVLASRA